MEKLWIIVAMGAVTYLPRALPLAVLAQMKIPEGFIRWLRFVPVAVLAALLAPELLLHEGAFDLSLRNQFLLAAVPCFLVAVKTKNLFFTVGVGLAAAILLQAVMPG
ncbi:AzlD domain-containing protein [Candidatus Desulforudis audaxviator]|uniref:Branched-chain amino acid transport n=1 Tax=Desulforudis audaxviator (strain MP104C) TaxID=477974 RepID=B1I1D5_DESAP|nr:AzlD domain-containing protein [Candidatus Desulforudis audaxviator]ACA58907.1 branched-chain amino acid transport [Candidatus Desulforudis audaxviator MP104C]AZK58926.1 branched-chain amino acid transport [Candidatus Desulforudis audaxviator]